MKRESSRFTLDELNQVIKNWDFVSEKLNGKLKLTKTTIDKRPFLHQAVNKENIDHLETVLYKLNIKIPFKGKSILITTSEYKTPFFEFRTNNLGFSFTISAEDYFEKFIKLFGSNELQTGDYLFDKKYLLDTSDDRKLNKFLDKKTRNWLNELTVGYFDLNSPKSKGKLSLYCTINEYSTENIEKQIAMFKYCIERITHANTL